MLAAKLTYTKKLWVLFLFLSIVCVTLLGVALNQLQETLTDSSKREIQAILNIAVNQASEIIEKEQNGELSYEEASEQVIALLSTMRYDHNYVWANDNHAIARVHIREERLGIYQESYLHDITALKNKDIIFKTQTNLKPFIDEKVIKTNGVTKLPVWEWTIGYGLYLDDVNSTIWKYMKSYFVAILVLGVLQFFIVAFLFRGQRTK